MALKDARADTFYYRTNTSAFQLNNLSEDNPDHQFAISDYLNLLTRIFHTDINPATNRPNPDYATTQLLSYAQAAGLGGVLDPNEVLASWLITPFVLFQANSYLQWWVKYNGSVGPVPAGLPQELYTTVDLTRTIARGVISPWTVFIFLVLACFIYFTCVACIIWSMTIQAPPTTHFQLVEFAARVVSKGQSNTSWATVLSKTANGDKGYLRSKLVDKNVYLGDVSTVGGIRSSDVPEYDDSVPFFRESTGTIGFSLTGDVAPLTAGKVYC